MSNESNLSRGERAVDERVAPLPQHHRLAVGDKVNGQTNPNGAPRASTDKKVGNANCTY